VKERLLKLESLHAFIHHPALRRLMEHFAGPRVLVHPKFVLRVIFPKSDRTRYRIHQDHEGVRGDPECFTLWTPFADCPVERGALQVMEASHHFGLQCDAAVGHVVRETARGGDWVVGDINAGDVLLMHSLTVHEPAGNRTDRFRLSIDCRFQDYERDFNPINVVSAGGWSWEKIYANWRSEEFKYYWKRLPLRLKPSMEELAGLAETSDAEETREKYARIVSQLETELVQG
jgi:ectoine hydroxylase-related dioxygenase (phytanoyl-CoA dioxygenase family)